jgi:hypothetical protein
MKNQIELLQEIHDSLEQIRHCIDASQPVDTIGATMALDTLIARTEIALLPSLDAQLAECEPDWVALVAALIPDIGDEYRASDDPGDETPGMQLTIGFTPATPDKDASWSYQTGDNSFTGGAYGHPHWGVVSLYRDSDAANAAEEIASQISELIAC